MQAHTAIDGTSFSPEVKAKCRDWHRRGAELIASLDELLERRKATEPVVRSAEVHIEEARAILASIRSALHEVIDGGDPLGEAVRRIQARLPPLAPAAMAAGRFEHSLR